jgi:hypothetical protein
MLMLALGLSACVTPEKPNPLHRLAVDECAESRQSSTKFNAQKSHQLIRKECEKILLLDEDYLRINNKNFRRREQVHYSDEQEYFDEEAWFLVTERIREHYYPRHLAPEDEVARARLLNEEQNKLEDKSIQREYEPRLMPISPYHMNYLELRWAGEATNELLYENRANKDLRRKLSVISVIITKKGIKKDVFLNRH